ncbi:MAG: alpha/beta fold hydrolase [Pseudomonadota bacterium]|nr:alpha/beta fold hydrolase [Pseudomonadota bacterium]
MATFVLVHGAWPGGWCWRDVRRHIEAAGHAVHSPTLTGVGERQHLISAVTDISIHIEDVVNLIAWEELADVILVGHSYGGMVITGVADRVQSVLRHVVYLDAFVPEDGDSSTSLGVRLMNPAATQEDFDKEITRRTERTNDTGGVPPDLERLFDIPLTEVNRRAWVARRVTPQPLSAQTTPVRLPNGGSGGLPRTYILCTGGPDRTPFMVLADKVRGDADWACHELATTHDAMVTMPDETADLLMTIAAD